MLNTSKGSARPEQCNKEEAANMFISQEQVLNVNECGDIKDLIKDSKYLIVSVCVDENLNHFKIVTFATSDIAPPDVVAGHGTMIRENGKIALYKPLSAGVFGDKFRCSNPETYWGVLCKRIPGLIVGDGIHDCTKKTRDYPRFN